jgi:hypothetical protein
MIQRLPHRSGLRKLQFKGINLLIANVAHEEGRTVVRHAGPGTKFAVVGANVLQARNCFQMRVGDSHAVEGRFGHFGGVKDNALAVVRPFQVPDEAEVFHGQNPAASRP